MDPIDLPADAVLPEPIPLDDECVVRTIELPVKGKGALVATLSACDRGSLTVRIDGEGEFWAEVSLDARTLVAFLLSLPPAPDEIAAVRRFLGH